jgi:hypothetical protein
MHKYDELTYDNKPAREAIAEWQEKFATLRVKADQAVLTDVISRAIQSADHLIGHALDYLGRYGPNNG